MRKPFYNRKAFLLSLIPIAILLIYIAGVYFPLTKTFYQQDEWWGMGLFRVLGKKFIFVGADYPYEIVWGKGRVFSGILFYFFYKYAPFQVFPIAIFGIVFHAINTILLYLLARKILNKFFPSLVAALFFAVNVLGQGAVTWPASVTVTVPSLTLIALSIFCFLNYLEKQKRKWIILTFICLYVSLGFKETGIYLFLFFPLISFLFVRTNYKKYIATYWPFLLFFLFNVLYRIFGFKSVSTDQWLYLTGATSSYWQTLLVRLIAYPLTSFSQIYIPPEPFLNLAYFVTRIYYPFFVTNQFALISQTAVLDLLSLIFSALLFVAISFLLKHSKKIERTDAYFWIGLAIFSFLPYAIISKSYSYFDSRHYYVGTFAGGMILAWSLKKTSEVLKLKYILIPVYALTLLFLFTHFRYVARDINKLVLISEERQSFLKQLSSKVPELKNNRSVFYIGSDKDYYVENNKIPFQQGTGYTLLVWYHPMEVPKSLLNNIYLYGIGSQGYQEEGGFGFGYYYDLEEFKKTVKKYNLKKDNIYSFMYNSKQKILEPYEI